MSARQLAAALLGLTERQATNIAIVTALCDSIRDTIITRAKDMPEEWDGIEMRELLASLFERERLGQMAHPMRHPGAGWLTRKRRFEAGRLRIGI